jgi:hypothetical protein
MKAEVHMDSLEGGFYFCSNHSCEMGLHVRAGDPGVHGDGNWAETGGITVGRLIVSNVYLCDSCARALIRGAVHLEIVPPPAKPTPASPPVQQALFTDP